MIYQHPCLIPKSVTNWFNHKFYLSSKTCTMELIELIYSLMFVDISHRFRPLIILLLSLGEDR